MRFCEILHIFIEYHTMLRNFSQFNSHFITCCFYRKETNTQKSHRADARWLFLGVPVRLPSPEQTIKKLAEVQSCTLAVDDHVLGQLDHVGGNVQLLIHYVTYITEHKKVS